MSMNPTTINRLKSLIALTAVAESMNPIEFEAYCSLAGIRIHPMVVSPTNLNEGIYHVTLPDYGYRCGYSYNGSPIEISY